MNTISPSVAGKTELEHPTESSTLKCLFCFPHAAVWMKVQLTFLFFSLRDCFCLEGLAHSSPSLNGKHEGNSSYILGKKSAYVVLN